MRLNRLLEIPFNGDPTELSGYVCANLKEIDGVKLHLDQHGNVYFQKGTSLGYPTYLAHINYMGNKDDAFQVKRLDKSVWIGYNDKLQPVKFGVESKAGLYVLYRLAKKLPAMKGVIVVNKFGHTDGTDELDLEFFSNSCWLAQFDKSEEGTIGTTFQTKPLGSDTFLEELKSLATKYNFGLGWTGRTDVTELIINKGVPLSGMNISTGIWAANQDIEQLTERGLFKASNFGAVLGTNFKSIYPRVKKTDRTCEYPSCTGTLAPFDAHFCRECLQRFKDQKPKCNECKALLLAEQEFLESVCKTCVSKKQSRSLIVRPPSGIIY